MAAAASWSSHTKRVSSLRGRDRIATPRLRSLRRSGPEGRGSNPPPLFRAESVVDRLDLLGTGDTVGILTASTTVVRHRLVAMEQSLENGIVDRHGRQGRELSGLADYAGDCLHPKRLELESPPTPQEVADGIGANLVSLRVRCRRCAPCARHRARVWSARGVAELDRARRVWFVTITLRDLHAKVRPWESPADNFARLLPEAKKEVTKALKRLRKGWKSAFQYRGRELHTPAARLRHLTVFEMHETGVPHAHALFFDQDGSCLWAGIERAFAPLGYVQARLLRGVEKGIAYALKGAILYDLKTSAVGARLHASLRFGKNPPARSVVSPELHSGVSSSSPYPFAPPARKKGSDAFPTKRGGGAGGRVSPPRGVYASGECAE